MLRGDRYGELTIPSKVFDNLRLPKVPRKYLFSRESRDVRLNLEGQFNDLSRLDLDIPGHDPFNIKSLAPNNVHFEIGGALASIELSHTPNTDIRNIIISSKNQHPEVLAFALLHAINRADLYSNAETYEKSAQMHKRLTDKLSTAELDKRHLKRVIANSSLSDTYEYIAIEERQVTEKTLEMIRRLISEGMNPIPHVTTYKQLTGLVNSSRVARTMIQFLMDGRDVFEYCLGYRYRMHMDEREVRNIMNGLPKEIEIPFK